MKQHGNNLLKHAGIYLLARGLPGIIAFLAIPLFTRLLDPAGYGKYALVLAAASLLSIVLFQGICLALVRFLPVYEKQPQRLKSTVMTLGVGLTLATGLGAAVACILPGLAPWRPVIAACWIVLAMQQPFDLFNEYARARMQPWRVMAMQLAKAVITALLGAGLIAAGAGWWGALVGTAVAMAIPNLVCYWRDWSSVRLGIDREVLRIVLQYGVPLSLTVALAGVIFCSDRFLIAWLMGEGDAGLYSASVDFTTRTLTLLLMVISSAMFPLAVRAWEDHGPEAARQQMSLNASLLMAVGLPAVAGLSVLAGSITSTFLGSDFRAAAATIMPLVALGSFLAGFKAYYWDTAFQLVHRTIHQVWIVLIVAILNIGLNLLAIPRLGINGAAGATVLAYAASIGITIWLGRRHFALPFPVRPFLQIVTSTLAMSTALYPVRNYRGVLPLAAQLSLGALVYAAALLTLNFMGSREAVLRRIAAGGAGAGQAAAATTISGQTLHVGQLKVSSGA